MFNSAQLHSYAMCNLAVMLSVTVQCRYAGCRYSECLYAECRGVVLISR
jgi:hypothetical protein